METESRFFGVGVGIGIGIGFKDAPCSIPTPTPRASIAASSNFHAPSGAPLGA